MFLKLKERAKRARENFGSGSAVIKKRWKGAVKRGREKEKQEEKEKSQRQDKEKKKREQVGAVSRG